MMSIGSQIVFAFQNYYSTSIRATSYEILIGLANQGNALSELLRYERLAVLFEKSALNEALCAR